MPSEDQIQTTLKKHFEAWNSGDRETWLSLWDDDVQIEDPVGGPQKSGRSAVEATWDNAFKDDATWSMHPLFVRVCGGEAALHAKNIGQVDGQEVVIESIEFWRFGRDGKVTGLRTFFAPPGGVELDPFFSKVTSK